MKLRVIVFLVVASLASFSSIAGQDEFKVCVKRCLSKISDDRKKCEYMCEPLLAE